jgi:hypothetical protein
LRADRLDAKPTRVTTQVKNDIVSVLLENIPQVAGQRINGERCAPHHRE